MANTETKKTNEKKQKEEEKKRKAGKILQKKLDEIESFGTVTDKQTGKWTYIDKDGKPAKILFDEKTKAFEVKKGEDNLYYATVEHEAFSIADVDDLAMITEVHKDPEIFINKYRMHDYIQRPDDIQKCFRICCLVLQNRIRFPRKPEDVYESQFNLKRIQDSYTLRMTTALKFRRAKAHDIMHKYNDGKFCNNSSLEGCDLPFSADKELNLQINEYGESVIISNKDETTKIKVEELQELDDFTSSIAAPEIIKDFLDIDEYKDRPTFLENAIELIEQNLKNNSAYNADNPVSQAKRKEAQNALIEYRKQFELETQQNQRTLSVDDF